MGGAENAGVENAWAITYGKPSEEKTLKIPVVYAKTKRSDGLWTMLMSTVTWCTHPCRQCTDSRFEQLCGSRTRFALIASVAYNRHQWRRRYDIDCVSRRSWLLRGVFRGTAWRTLRAGAVRSSAFLRGVPTQHTTKAVAVLFAAHPSQWCGVCTNWTYSKVNTVFLLQCSSFPITDECAMHFIIKVAS